MPAGWIKVVTKEFKKNPELVCLSGPHKFYDTPKSFRLLNSSYNLAIYATYISVRHILKIGSVTQGGNFIAKREALEKIGGFNHRFNFYGDDTDIAARLHKIGDVKFTLNLPVESSGRRLAKEGVLNIAFRYSLEYFWVVLFDKPLHKTYKVDNRFNKNQQLKMAFFKKPRATSKTSR